METWATKRLDALVLGAAPPPVIQTIQLGTLDAWGEGWAKKIWHSKAELLNVDGSVFGGYLAALADQILAFAAMTMVPGDKVFRTCNLNVSFYRASKDASIHIEGKVVSQSRQTMNVKAEFRNDAGELIAEASAIQILQAM
jgi:uncharacterized protein (TIGR00369 family)